MDQYHRGKNKKARSGTGAKTTKYRDKKKAHIGSPFVNTRLSEETKKVVRKARGGNRKVKLQKHAYVNVSKEKGKVEKVKIETVLESHNPEFARRNIITKGAILKTPIGKVLVTNRVGQDGVINGVLYKE